MVFTIGDLKSVYCSINNTNIKLLIDLGAKVSLISRATYDQYFSDIRLNKPAIQLVSYDGSGIVTLGCLQYSVRYNNVFISDFTFLFTATGRSVMGIDYLMHSDLKSLIRAMLILLWYNSLL
jgi:hypothetical protein